MAEYIRNEQNIDRLFIAYIKIKYKDNEKIIILLWDDRNRESSIYRNHYSNY